MDEPVAFRSLLIVFAIAFLAPFVLGLTPRFRLPAVVLEILMGIVVGPSVLGWVQVDLPLEVLATIGVALLFFLAGGEVEIDRIPPEIARIALFGFALSVVLAFAVAFGLAAAGVIAFPVAVGILLVSCGLGVVVPVLKDSGQLGRPFGEFVLTGATLREFGAVLLLTLFLTAGQERPLDRLALVAVFLVSCGALALTLRLLTRFKGLSEVLYRLADTTAQIQVRGAMLLLVVFAALAEAVNLEIILGTFFAGMLVMLTDRRAVGPHVEFRQKLEAIGFGVFVPVFFIVSGVRFDLPALLSSPLAMAQAPVVFLALLVIHGLPAAVYLPFLGGRGTVAAGLLQASSLSFLVAGSQIALGLGALDTATASGLVAGGLLSSVVYPLLALTVLGGAPALLRPTASLTVVPRRLLTQHTKPGEPR